MPFVAKMLSVDLSGGEPSRRDLSQAVAGSSSRAGGARRSEFHTEAVQAVVLLEGGRRVREL